MGYRFYFKPLSSFSKTELVAMMGQPYQILQQLAETIDQQAEVRITAVLFELFRRKAKEQESLPI